MTDDKHRSQPINSAGVDRSDDRPVIFVDADNTLWDTDKVFADAQLELLCAVENVCDTHAETSNRLDFVRSIDQELAERHHLSLRYPPRLLIVALSWMLHGKSVKEAAKIAWIGGQESKIVSVEAIGTIEGCYFANLLRTPPLRPGVKSGLSELHTVGARILVLTEGHRDRVVKTAQAHELMPLVDRVIEAKKNRRLFERILRLVGNPPVAVMIGDQVSKDIIPARQAGLRTIYIPGGFKPKWEGSGPKDMADFQLDSFTEVPATIAQICRDKEVENSATEV